MCLPVGQFLAKLVAANRARRLSFFERVKQVGCDPRCAAEMYRTRRTRRSTEMIPKKKKRMACVASQLAISPDATFCPFFFSGDGSRDPEQQHKLTHHLSIPDESGNHRSKE